MVDAMYNAHKNFQFYQSFIFSICINNCCKTLLLEIQIFFLDLFLCVLKLVLYSLLYGFGGRKV